MAKNNSSSSGCVCLILIVLAIGFVFNKCNESSSNQTDKDSRLTYSSVKRNSSIDYTMEDELSDEEKQYLNNSLSTGATPYTTFYGKNYNCPYNQCSGIKVSAPTESDIVVIIKRNNQDGKVINHGYIKSGDTYQFDIPNGTYQTFFYYGNGWNPNKDMGNGIKGGFIKDEIFSKDNPQDIASGVLTYVLQLQRDGNFQTKGSDKSEIF